MCVAAGQMMDRIDPASWYMRKQGWAGMTNPANVLLSRVDGRGKTKTEKKAVAMGIAERDQRHAASSVTGQPAHAVTIAARKAKG